MARFLVCLGLLVAAQTSVAQPNGPWMKHPTGERNEVIPDGQLQRPIVWLGLQGVLSVTIVRHGVVSKEAEFELPRITKGAADSLQAVYAAITEDLVFALGAPDTTTEHSFEDIPLNSEEPFAVTLGRMVWGAGTHRRVTVEFQAIKAVNSQHVVVRMLDNVSRLPRSRPRP